jgi:hypothetical protein
VQPEEGESVHQVDPVYLGWSGTGRGNRFRLQVSLDSLSGHMLLDTVLQESRYIYSPLVSGQAYAWRVAAVVDGQQPAWSSTRIFHASTGYLDLTSPDSTGTLYRGQPYAIRWNSNIGDSVSIRLFRGGIFEEQIARLPAPNHAYTWIVSSSAVADSTYRIIIHATADTTLIDSSASPFSIASPTSVVAAEGPVPRQWKIFQNYPNPFNPTTRIMFSVPSKQHVTLTVHTMLGQPVALLVNDVTQAGDHSIVFDGSHLPSGVYTYTIRGEETILSRKMILMK